MSARWHVQQSRNCELALARLVCAIRPSVLVIEIALSMQTCCSNREPTISILHTDLYHPWIMIVLNVLTLLIYHSIFHYAIISRTQLTSAYPNDKDRCNRTIRL